MTYRTESLQLVQNKLDALMLEIKRFASTHAAITAAGTTADILLNIRRRLMQADVQLNSYKATPGLVAYVRNEKDDPTYDVVGAFNAVQDEVGEIANFIETNLPASGGMVLEFSGDYVAYKLYTSTQIAPLTTRLNTLAGLIE